MVLHGRHRDGREPDYMHMSNEERAGISPLGFREAVLSGLLTNVPPRWHNGELCAMMAVDRMSSAQQLQVVGAVRLAQASPRACADRAEIKKFRRENPGHANRGLENLDHYYDCLLGDIVSAADTPVAVEAALSYSDPLEGLRGLVERMDGSTTVLPDQGALLELVRRAATSPEGEVLEQPPRWLLDARETSVAGSPARGLLDRCVAACPGGWEHTAESSDAQARLLAARGRPSADKSLVLQELAAGSVPAALALVDRVDPADLPALEEEVATVPDSTSRDIVLVQVRARRSAVAGHPRGQANVGVSGPSGHDDAPVVNWCGEIPIRIHYESHGSPDAEPVVLLMGQMMQLNAWPEQFVAGLVKAGRRVILVDNRDIGFSTKLAGVPADSDAAVAATLTGRRPVAPYSLGDMADDVAGLLEHLNISKAQIVGQSMGGMIAQEVAIRHPDKVGSVVSLSSMTGDPAQMQSTPEAMLAVTSVPAFTGDPETDREVFVEHSVVYQAFASKKYRDDGRSRAAAAASWDRAAPDEGSFPRQLAAIYASGDRTGAFAEVAAARGPGFATFVHGADDTLICPQAARYAAAQCSSGGAGDSAARVVVLDDMGHDLPLELCDRVVSLVVSGDGTGGF